MRPETINGWALTNKHGAVFPETTRRTKRECVAAVRASHGGTAWAELQSRGLSVIRVMLRPIHDGRAVSAARTAEVA
jgi:hypothetical protein